EVGQRDRDARDEVGPDHERGAADEGADEERAVPRPEHQADQVRDDESDERDDPDERDRDAGQERDEEDRDYAQALDVDTKVTRGALAECEEVVLASETEARDEGGDAHDDHDEDVDPARAVE